MNDEMYYDDSELEENEEDNYEDEDNEDLEGTGGAPEEEQGTSYADVYNSFLDRVTDDMFISWTKEETYEDIDSLLSIAITRFRMPRENLRQYTTITDEDGFEIKQFTSTLSYETIDILALLMVREWINRQINTVRLTEMQYTGNDLKAINTKVQMEALAAIKKNNESDLTGAYHSYQYQYFDDNNGRWRVSELNLAGKKNINQSTLDG